MGRRGSSPIFGYPEAREDDAERAVAGPGSRLSRPAPNLQNRGQDAPLAKCGSGSRPGNRGSSATSQDPGKRRSVGIGRRHAETSAGAPARESPKPGSVVICRWQTRQAAGQFVRNWWISGLQGPQGHCEVDLAPGRLLRGQFPPVAYFRSAAITQSDILCRADGRSRVAAAALVLGQRGRRARSLLLSGEAGIGKSRASRPRFSKRLACRAGIRACGIFCFRPSIPPARAASDHPRQLGARRRNKSRRPCRQGSSTSSTLCSRHNADFTKRPPLFFSRKCCRSRTDGRYPARWKLTSQARRPKNTGCIASRKSRRSAHDNNTGADHIRGRAFGRTRQTLEVFGPG